MSSYFRALATGGASCEPTDGAGSSGGAQNPMSRLANAVLGDRGKHAREEQLREVESQGASPRSSTTRWNLGGGSD